MKRDDCPDCDYESDQEFRLVAHRKAVHGGVGWPRPEGRAV